MLVVIADGSRRGSGEGMLVTVRPVMHILTAIKRRHWTVGVCREGGGGISVSDGC